MKRNHHGRISGGKRKKVDKKKEEAVEVSSGSKEHSENAGKNECTKLKKEVIGLKNNFNKFKKAVKEDLSDKWNLKALFKKLDHKYTKRVSSPSIDEDTSSALDYGDNSDNISDVGTNNAQEDTMGKGKRPLTRFSSKKTFSAI